MSSVGAKRASDGVKEGESLQALLNYRIQRERDALMDREKERIYVTLSLMERQ